MTTPLVSNDAFFKAIFGDQYKRVHITSFIESPDAIPEGANGRCWAGRHYENQGVSPMNNNFFAISLFKDIELDGFTHHVRQESQLEACYLIGLDDVGVGQKTDADIAKYGLPLPTYELETSPGNMHVGFRIEPCNEAYKIKAIQKHLIRCGLCKDAKDPGMFGVTRYLRMPIGTNTKTGYLDHKGDGFETKMISWNPDRVYTADRLIEMLGIDNRLINEIRNQELTKKARGQNLTATKDNHALLRAFSDKDSYRRNCGNGWHGVICPRYTEHTGEDKSGSYVVIDEDNTWGFRCHHGSHIDTYHALEVYNDLKEEGYVVTHPYFAHDDADHPVAITEVKLDATGRPILKALRRTETVPEILKSTEWIFDDVIPAGCGTLSGAPGMGKTTFATGLCLYVAGFGNYIDSVSTPHLKVARPIRVISENPEQWQRSFFGYCERFEIPREEVDRAIAIYSCDKQPPVTVLSEVKAEILHGGYNRQNAPLIIIDTIGSIFEFRGADGQGGENSNDAVGSAIATIKMELWESLGVSTLMIAHPPKGGTGVRGASAFEGNAHYTMEIASLTDEKGSTVKVLSMVKRRVETSTPHLYLGSQLYQVETVDPFDGEKSVEHVRLTNIALLSEEELVDLKIATATQEKMIKEREKEGTKIEVAQIKVADILNRFRDELKSREKFYYTVNGGVLPSDIPEDLEDVPLFDMEEFFDRTGAKTDRNYRSGLKDRIQTTFAAQRIEKVRPGKVYFVLFDAAILEDLS